MKTSALKDKLRANWWKSEQDIMLHHPLGFGTNRDASYLSTIFNKAFKAEMYERGYDITTMKFSIAPQKGHVKFSSERKDDE